MSLDRKRATHYVPRARQLRMDKGVSQNKVAAQAVVDKKTLALVEKKHAVAEEKANAIFNALNELHGGKLDRNSEITTQHPR